VATETLKKKALELQQAEETEERLRELSSAIEVAKQLLARLEQDLRQQEEDQARQQGRDAQKQKNPRKDGEGPDEVEEEEEDDVTPEEEEEKEEDARFLQALEKESYEELVKLSEDIEKQFEAKRSRLRDLETRIEETQTEMTHLTEAIRTEQQKAVEGIRAEERKTACLKQKEEILRALSRACRQGAARSSSSSLGQKKKEEEENHGYFEGLSSGAIIETIDSRLDALRQESIDAATSTKAKLQNLHREEEVLQNRCSSLQSTLASREEVTNLLNLQLERAREQLQEKTKKKMNFNQALQDIEEELKKKEKEALEGSETKTEGTSSEVYLGLYLHPVSWEREKGED
ncbi:smc n terminal domain-containing protein, partial [Cystoisospora suis]